MRLDLRKITLILSVIVHAHLTGQLSTDNTRTAADLVKNVLLGEGIEVSNIQYTGAAEAVGTFSGNTSLDLSSGILLTTGTVLNNSYGPHGPNNYSNLSVDNYYGSDPLLNYVVGFTTYNAAVLEFDFVPSHNNVSFRYVFASEEYPEYVCTQYNDIFGFFVTGENPDGVDYVNYNMALVPGKHQYVSINTINSGYQGTQGVPWMCQDLTNSHLYFNNGQGTPGDPANGTSIQYDGFTTALEAKFKVKCGQTYHIKIAIADVSDARYDSGVFLEAGSFSSGTTPSVTVSQFCAGDPVQATPDDLSYVPQWYYNESDVTPFATGNLLQMNNINSATTVYMDALNSYGCLTPRIAVPLNPKPLPIFTTVTGDQVCPGATANLSVATTAPTVHWYTDAGLTNRVHTGMNYTTPALTSSTTYYVQAIGTNGCNSLVSQVEAQVYAEAIITEASSDTVCEGQQATIQVTTNEPTVNWYSDAGLSNWIYTGKSATTYSLTEEKTYYIQAVSANGCLSAVSTAYARLHDNPMISAVSPASVCPGNAATLGATTTAPTLNWYEDDGLTTLLHTGNSYTTPVLNSNKTYYLQAVSSEGCLSKSNTSVAATMHAVPVASNVVNDTVCEGGTADLEVITAEPIARWYADAAGTSLLFTGKKYTTPALTTATTYYVQLESANGCLSALAPVGAYIYDVPTIDNVENTAICKGETGVLKIETSEPVTRWYADNGLTNLLHTGKEFTTPALTTDTDYYVQVTSVHSCVSSVHTAQVTVYADPVITSVTGASVCKDEQATLQADTDLPTINWYSDAGLTSLVGTGKSFVTPALTTNATYYVQAVSATGCKTAVETVTASVFAEPQITAVGNATVCPGDVASLSVTTTAPTVRWYSDAALTNEVHTGKNFTTPSISVVTSYYVQAESSDGCLSESATVSVDLYAVPLITGVVDNTVCQGATASLSITTNGATSRWYSDNGLTNLIHMGTSFTTPALTTQQSYFVQVESTDGCLSASQEVVAGVYAKPVISDVTHDSICLGEQATLAVSTAAPTINWYSDAGLTNQVGTGSSFTTPSLSADASYYVQVISADGCESEVSTVNAGIYATPVIAAYSNDEVCKGSQAVLQVSTTESTVEWYSDAALSNWIYTGKKYTTIALTENKEVYVQLVSANGCKSAAQKLTATVYDDPTVTSVQGDTVCQGEQATLSVTTDAAVVRWYEDDGLTTLVHTGTQFTTPALTNHKTYYVQVESSDNCLSTGQAVYARVYDVPLITSVKGDTVCVGDVATIEVQTSEPTVNWYAESGLTTLLHSGKNYQTEAVNAPRSFYAQAVTAEGCVSAVSEVKVENFDVPVHTVSGDTKVCKEGQAVMQVNSSADIVNWYSDAEMSNWLFTGKEFTSVPLSYETLFFTQVTSADGCKSDVVKWTVDVHNVPVIGSGVNDTVCLGEVASLAVETSEPTALWYADAGLTQLLHTGKTYETEALQQNTTYHVIPESSAGCRGMITTVNAVLRAKPVIASVTNDKVCEGGTAFLEVRTTAPEVKWYSEEELTNLLRTGSQYKPENVMEAVSYFAQAVSEYGCVGEVREVTVGIHDMPTITSTQDDAVCQGERAELGVTADGGIAHWYSDEGLTSEIHKGAIYTTPALSAEQIYYVQVRSGESCVSSVAIIKASVYDVPVMTEVIHDEICPGDQADLGIVSSEPTTKWYSDSQLNNLIHTGKNYLTEKLNTPTSYYAQLESVNGCTSEVVKVDVGIFDQPELNSVSYDTVCVGEEVVVNASGTSGTYNWTIDGEAYTGAEVRLSDLQDDVEYSVELVSGDMCKSEVLEGFIRIHQLPFTPEVQAETVCMGQPVELRVQNPSHLVEWSIAGQKVAEGESYQMESLNDTTTLEVVSESSHGCRTSAAVTVNPLPVPAAVSAEYHQVCSGGSVLIEESNWGDDQLFWYKGEELIYTGTEYWMTNITEDFSGYRVVENEHGCLSEKADLSVRVKFLPPTPEVHTAPICQDNKATLRVINPTGHVRWLSASGQELAEGAEYVTGILHENTTFQVTQDNKLNCRSEMAQVEQEVNPTPTDPAPLDMEVCKGDAAELAPEHDGVQLFWYTDGDKEMFYKGNLHKEENIQNDLRYWSVSVSENGCFSEASPVDVKVMELPEVEELKGDTICLGDTVRLTSSPSQDQVKWYDDQQQMIAEGAVCELTNITENGVYYAQATTDKGCIGTMLEVSVVVNDKPTITAAPMYEICEGESATLQVEADMGEVEWINATGEVVATGTSFQLDNIRENQSYQVLSRTDGTGCLSEESTVNVEVLTLPALPVVEDKAVCDGESAILEVASPQGTVEWRSVLDSDEPIATGARFEVNPKTTASYFVQIVNDQQCRSVVQEVTVEIRENPKFSSLPEEKVCLGGDADVRILASQATLHWFDSENDGAEPVYSGFERTFKNVQESKSFWLKLEDEWGCWSDMRQLDVKVVPNPVAEFDVKEACVGERVEFTIPQEYRNAGLTFNWDFGDNTEAEGQEMSHRYNQQGVYVAGLTVRNGLGCESFIEKSLKVYGGFVVDFSMSDEEGYIPFVVEFTNHSDRGLEYRWTFGDGATDDAFETSHTFDQIGEYEVLLTAWDSLGCRDSVKYMILADAQSKVEFPDVFTPNGDNINDQFEARYEFLESMQVTIFNRWGTKVGMLTAPAEGWDGFNASGEACSDGTYYYVGEAIGRDGAVHKLKGYFQLMR